MKQSTALERLKEARRQRATLEQPARQHAAAASDADNEAYMQQFEAAFQQLSHSSPNPPAGQLQPPAAQQHGPSSPAKPAQRRPAPSTPSIAAAGVSRQQHAAAAGWRTGPVDAAGVLVRVSERPLMCSAVMADGSGDVVVGSSDHALYVVDPAAGCRKRTLYSKTTGHTEWVTCVCCLPGGRVLSCGMDGRLWLWPAAGTAGTEVKAAHDAPVSKVAALQHSDSSGAPQTAAPAAAPGRAGLARASSGSSRARAACAGRGQAAAHVLAVSCSYDKTVKVWDVSGRAGKLVSVMSGHAGPVLELAVVPGGGQVLTGDRRGNLMCWDVGTASSGWGAKNAHAGHITALAWQQDQQQEQQQHAADSSTLALSGGQDGYLRVWDGRSGSHVAQQRLHASAQGKGAVGGIVTVAAGGRQLVVTAGADQTLRIADPAASYSPIASVQLTDFPYSLAAVGGGLVACGCGDGSVHIVDVVEGVTLYALGAGQAAVRALEAGPERLVCSGDDGCVVAYSFV